MPSVKRGPFFGLVYLLPWLNMSREPGGEEYSFRARPDKQTKKFTGARDRGGRIAAEAHTGLVKNKINEGEKGVMSPANEIDKVMGYLRNIEQPDKQADAITAYIKWAMQNINKIDLLEVDDKELGVWKCFGATLGAGGGGKDTSQNGRGNTHLVTGIYESCDKDRRAEGNAIVVMEKLRERLKTHLENWRLTLGLLKKGDVVRKEVFENVVMDKVAG